MRVVLIGLATFLLTFGGSAAFFVVRAPKAAAQTVATATPADSGHAPAHRAATRAVHDSTGPLTTASVAEHASGITPEAAAASAAAPGEHATTAADGATPAATRADSARASVRFGNPPPAPSPHVTLHGPATAAAAPAQPDTIQEKHTRQLVRIFATLPPATAAEVIGQLNDSEALAVLTRLGARQAAGIIGVLPNERAASLSRQLLNLPRGSSAAATTPGATHTP